MARKNLIQKVRVRLVEDESADPSYLDQDEYAERRERYRQGDFGFVGVVAEAEILLPKEGGGGIVQTIRSPGLWGVESDSEDEYLRQVGGEELDQLEEMLSMLNVNVRPLKELRVAALEGIRE